MNKLSNIEYIFVDKMNNDIANMKLANYKKYSKYDKLLYIKFAKTNEKKIMPAEQYLSDYPNEEVVGEYTRVKNDPHTIVFSLDEAEIVAKCFPVNIISPYNNGYIASFYKIEKFLDDLKMNKVKHVKNNIFEINGVFYKDTTVGCIIKSA